MEEVFRIFAKRKILILLCENTLLQVLHYTLHRQEFLIYDLRSKIFSVRVLCDGFGLLETVGVLKYFDMLLGSLIFSNY